MPYKHLPVLDVDGVRISQSLAIIRYLAREFDLSGKDSITLAKADEFAEACSDVMMKLHVAENAEDRKVCSESIDVCVSAIALNNTICH